MTATAAVPMLPLPTGLSPGQVCLMHHVATALAYFESRRPPDPRAFADYHTAMLGIATDDNDTIALLALVLLAIDGGASVALHNRIPTADDLPTQGEC